LQAAIQPVQVHGLVQDFDRQDAKVTPVIGKATSEHLVRDDTYGVQVGATVGAPALEQFRRHTGMEDITTA
jgi:hypothetical protein